MGTCVCVGIGAVMIILKDDRLANRTTGVWWSRFSSFVTPMRVTVTGRENVVKGQSYIVVSNHQSQFDIFVLFGWLGIDLKWVIKKELLKFPVFAYAARHGGNIIIDRSDKQEAYRSLETARQKLTGGTSLIILPEGTRSRTGELGEFKKGAFWLAQNMDLPILPITITGTRDILPPDSFDLFPGRAVMRIHPPVDPGDYGEDSFDELIADVREAVRRGLEEHRR